MPLPLFEFIVAEEFRPVSRQSREYLSSQLKGFEIELVSEIAAMIDLGAHMALAR
jgi:hypothetical protein